MEDTKKKLERGKRLYQIFKQDQYATVPVAKQVIIYYALVNGLLDNVPVDRVHDFEIGLFQYSELNNEAEKEIAEKKELTDDTEAKITKLINDYKSTLDYLIQ